MHSFAKTVAFTMAYAVVASIASAQALPTAQPGMITIVRDQVKHGLPHLPEEVGDLRNQAPGPRSGGHDHAVGSQSFSRREVNASHPRLLEEHLVDRSLRAELHTEGDGLRAQRLDHATALGVAARWVVIAVHPEVAEGWKSRADRSVSWDAADAIA